MTERAANRKTCQFFEPCEQCCTEDECRTKEPYTQPCWMDDIPKATAYCFIRHMIRETDMSMWEPSLISEKRGVLLAMVTDACHLAVRAERERARLLREHP